MTITNEDAARAAWEESMPRNWDFSAFIKEAEQTACENGETNGDFEYTSDAPRVRAAGANAF